MNLKNITEYICIHKKEKPERNCETCNGITCLCGRYENKYNEDIFNKYKLEEETG